jgi:hypothetical protein
MEKKKLKPRLPKDEAEIIDKGFQGNLTESKRFITDGHSLLLAERVVKGWTLKKFEGFQSKPVTDASINVLWEPTAKRSGKKASFIGCGRVGFDSDDEPIVVAVVRSENGETVGVNPWILKFAASIVGADGLSVSSGPKWAIDPINLLRGEEVVGMIMPMRYYGSDLGDYDLDGPAAPLSEVSNAVS